MELMSSAMGSRALGPPSLRCGQFRHGIWPFGLSPDSNLWINEVQLWQPHFFFDFPRFPCDFTIKLVSVKWSGGGEAERSAGLPFRSSSWSHSSASFLSAVTEKPSWSSGG